MHLRAVFFAELLGTGGGDKGKHENYEAAAAALINTAGDVGVVVWIVVGVEHFNPQKKDG